MRIQTYQDDLQGGLLLRHCWLSRIVGLLSEAVVVLGEVGQTRIYTMLAIACVALAFACASSIGEPYEADIELRSLGYHPQENLPRHGRGDLSLDAMKRPGLCAASRYGCCLRGKNEYEFSTLIIAEVG